MPSASLAPFRVREFRLLWFGALISNIGTWMSSIALSYYVADTTRQPSWSAIVAAAGFVPQALVGPVGSAMADRLDRRRVLVGYNVVAAAIAMGLAWKVGSGGAGPAFIAVTSFMTGCCFAFGFPSFQVTIPTLVPREQLVAAVGLSNAQWNLGRTVGPAVAAIAIAIGGIELALWCNAASFSTTIVAVLICDLPYREPVQRKIFGALADGIRFARTNPAMRRMVPLMVLTVFLAAPFQAFVSQMATTIYDGNSTTTSIMTTAQGIGAVLAAFSLGGITARWGANRVLAAAITGTAVALVTYGMAPNLLLGTVALCLVGYGYGCAFTSFAGVAQHSAPDAMRGRVLAVNTFTLGAMYPLGTLVQGTIADRVGLRWVTSGSGVLLFGGLLLVLLAGGHLPRGRLPRSQAGADLPA